MTHVNALAVDETIRPDHGRRPGRLRLAFAIGHPLGGSGARLATTLLNVLELREARHGLQVMCEAGGLANATIIERT
ncbi:hypothetical protein [Nocardioides sp.]|uniref:hypothetical protein n=1 Tax=Nocardioides sp. TaxID=35761 RepID=UPI001F107350|nr:hypothetical protein [Nocardioides sp.]